MTITAARPAALVTGSSRGIGRAVALALAEAGYDLVIHGRSTAAGRERLAAVAAQVEERGARCRQVTGALEDADCRARLVADAAAAWGRLDCLVNNAGTAALRRGDLLDVREDSYDLCLNVNAKAVFFLCQQAATLMLKQTPLPGVSPTLINVTSCSAVILSPSRGEYCISKSAASMVSQLFALRLAATPVRVFEIRPGIIKTDMTAAVTSKYDALIAGGLVPAQRWGQPEDIARAAVAAATGQIPYTVGQVLEIDGGLSLRNF